MQSIQLLQGHPFGLFGELVAVDLFAQGVDVTGRRVCFPEFPLDGANLFAQEEIALAFAHRGSDFLLDFRAQGEHLQFAAEQRQDAGEPLPDHVDFEQLLPLFQA